LFREDLAANTPVYMPWILLDFLGFSRSNLYFSMGYADFGGKNFSQPSSPALRDATTGASGRGHAEGQNRSPGKLSLASDFLQ
jgi:hypothetical protein